MCKCAFLSVLTLLLVVGCGGGGPVLTEAEKERIAITEKIELVEGAGGLVLIVGGETITSDEIPEAPVGRYGSGVILGELLGPIAQRSELEQFREEAKLVVEDVVLGKISGILLYQHAKRELGANIEETLEKLAEKELRKFVLRYGADEAKADEVLEEMGMDRESFKEEHKKMIVTQSYLAKQLPYEKPITYSELVEYYEKVKDESFFRPAMLKFRLIDIEPAELEIADANMNRSEEAMKLAEKVMAQIAAGEDFSELAEEYSKSQGVVHRAMKVSSIESLDKPYDILAEHVEGAKPGDIAGPIRTEAGEHIFVMKLEEKQTEGYEPLEKVQAQLVERIHLERQNEAIGKLNAKLLRQAEIGETDKFVDFCIDKIYRMYNEK